MYSSIAILRPTVVPEPKPPSKGSTNVGQVIAPRERARHSNAGTRVICVCVTPKVFIHGVRNMLDMRSKAVVKSENWLKFEFHLWSK